MIDIGVYKKKKTDFSQYLAPHFRPEGKRGESCGEDALLTLTNKGFTKEQRRRYGSVLRKREMVKILKERGYTVIPLNICAVSNTNYIANKITDAHVVLCCQLMYKGEASWSILNAGVYGHNSGWYIPHQLEFINRPIIAAYLVWHKKWA